MDFTLAKGTTQPNNEIQDSISWIINNTGVLPTDSKMKLYHDSLALTGMPSPLEDVGYTLMPCEGVLCLRNLSDSSVALNANGSTMERRVNEYNWEALLPVPLVIFGITGNLLVCLAIAMEKRLQTVTNYFLFSLAVTDLLVSLIVMPFNIINEFRGYWIFGTAVCNLFVTADVLMCTASILHLCTISVDRYIGIRYPLRSRNKSKTTVALKLGVVWSLSFVVTSPITVLGMVNKTNLFINEMCALNNNPFIIYGSVIAFFIPLVIMVVTNILTVQLLNEQAHLCNQKKSKEGWPMIRRLTGSRKIPKNSKHLLQARFQSAKLSNSHTSSSKVKGWSRDTNGNRKFLSRKCSSAPDSLTGDSSEIQPLNDTASYRSDSASPNEMRPSRLRVLIQKHSIAVKAANILLLRKETIAKENSVQTEQKATKVLGVVFTIFIICWAPFFIVNIMTALCAECDVNRTLFVAFIWLGYVSSTLNPIIYTMFNRTFKKTFGKLLCCKYQSFRKINRTQSLKVSDTNFYPGTPSLGTTDSHTETLC